MAPEDLETKLYELALTTQCMLFAAELGQKSAAGESVEKLKLILDSLKASNSHITLFRRKQIVWQDGTQANIEHQLLNYCFIDEDSSDPSYYCEISAAIVIDGRQGHPVPRKGDVWVRIARAPEHEEDDEETDDSPPPEQEDRPADEEKQDTEEDFGRMLKRMGFDPEKRE